jgi:uroporphyrin-III C-methyltransferase/precorrin-2 dehydrogenase/sirohydrochlorin ferrochelatase
MEQRKDEDRLSHDARQAAVGLQPLSVLPVFFKLKDRRVLLAGATERAAWKTELLAATGAQVMVCARDPHPSVRALAERCDNVSLVERDWDAADLAGVVFALIDTVDEAEAARFRTAAEARGLPINAIDNPAFCDFQFGAIVNRSPLVIGISTDGAAPVFGQAIRGRLETLLPPALQSWARAARAWRARLHPHDLSFRARRRFWEVFSEKALRTESLAPTNDDFAACLQSAREAAPEPSQPLGQVTLVGAGPGDPDLITLKALRALQSADVVLYDNLVAPAIVDMARREAQKIDVGKRGYRPSCKQDDISEMIVALAREGKHVVRLKGGDPMIFGRANEEIAACRAADVPISVIPGVTAALGAAASLGTSLTERTVARRLQFITAHAKDGRLPEDIDWPALCDPHAATIVYMGVRTMDALVAVLMAHGLAPDTPAVLVERATLPQERRYGGAIVNMPALTKQVQPDGPCLLMIGLVFGPAATAAHHSLDAQPAVSALSD